MRQPGKGRTNECATGQPARHGQRERGLPPERRDEHRDQGWAEALTHKKHHSRQLMRRF